MLANTETYFSILSNPAHIGAEITWDIILDVFGVILFWPVIRWAVRRHDRIKHPKENNDRATTISS